MGQKTDMKGWRVMLRGSLTANQNGFMTAPSQNSSKIEEVIADAKAGKLFILVDDEARENEGDLCVVAECATADAIVLWQNMDAA